MSDSKDIRLIFRDFRVALRGTGRILWWVAAAGLVGWLLSGISCIEANQAGFVTRFGRVVRKDLQPGLHFLLPWPIEKLRTAHTKDVSSLEAGFSVQTTGDHVKISDDGHEIPYCFTGDQNVIHISMVAQYQIRDAYGYLYEVADAERTLKHVLNDAILICTAGMTIDGILTTEKEALLSRTHQAAQFLLDEVSSGLLIRDLQFKTPPTVPPQTQAAFQGVVDARVGMQTARNRAEESARSVTADAMGRSEQITQEAHAAQYARIQQAESDASRFLAVLREYETNKAITRLRMHLEMMDDVMSKVEKYVLPAAVSKKPDPATGVPKVVTPRPLLGNHGGE